MKNKKLKTKLEWLLKTTLIRIQVLCVSLGGLILIMHFNLTDNNIMYIPLGLIGVIVTIAMITPYPFWWELEAGKDREKYYGDDFKDGLF